jgi:hypothetical protein
VLGIRPGIGRPQQWPDDGGTLGGSRIAGAIPHPGSHSIADRPRHAVTGRDAVAHDRACLASGGDHPGGDAGTHRLPRPVANADTHGHTGRDAFTHGHAGHDLETCHEEPPRA